MTFEDLQKENPFASPYNWALKWLELELSKHNLTQSNLYTLLNSNFKEKGTILGDNLPPLSVVDIYLRLQQYQYCGKEAQNEADYYFKLLIIQ